MDLFWEQIELLLVNREKQVPTVAGEPEEGSSFSL